MFGRRPLSGAAFSAARYKIQPIFFQELNKLLLRHIYSLKPRLWKGFRIVAIDGTSILLPASPQIKKVFGVFDKTSRGTNTCLAQSVMLYDVLSDFVLGIKLDKMCNGEKTVLRSLFSTIEIQNALYLLDRGFGNLSTCKMIVNSGSKFCIRFSINVSGFAKKSMEDERQDFIATWIPSETERANCRQNGFDEDPIKVRVTKLLLASGEIELLISNVLDFDQFSTQEIGKLYFMRWGIEEGFKKLKPKMKLEHFGCKKPEGIYQEFYAHIFMMNLLAIIGQDAQHGIDKQTQNRKIKYTYNWQNAYNLSSIIKTS